MTDQTCSDRDDIMTDQNCSSQSQSTDGASVSDRGDVVPGVDVTVIEDDDPFAIDDYEELRREPTEVSTEAARVDPSVPDDSDSFFPAFRTPPYALLVTLFKETQVALFFI